MPFSKFVSGGLELLKFGKNVQMIFIHENKTQDAYWFKQGRESVVLIKGTTPACLFSVLVSLFKSF
jgi:hypothetical protein